MDILLGDKVYRGNRKICNNCLNTAREKYKKDNVNAIYGTEKDNVLQMMDTVFDTKENLEIAVLELEKLGFKCYYYIKKGRTK